MRKKSTPIRLQHGHAHLLEKGWINRNAWRAILASLYEKDVKKDRLHQLSGFIDQNDGVHKYCIIYTT